MSEPILKTDLTYFGSIHFVKTLMENRNVVFDLEAPITKMSFKNRMVIITSQGPLILTIPIVGGRDQKTAIKDIKIAYIKLLLLLPKNCSCMPKPRPD